MSTSRATILPHHLTSPRHQRAIFARCRALGMATYAAGAAVGLSIAVAPRPAHAQATRTALPTQPTQATTQQAMAKSMNVSINVVQQIQALNDDKAARSPAQQKMSSGLIYTARMYQGLPVVPGLPKLKTGVTVSASGQVVCDLQVATISTDLLQAIGSAGGTVLGTYADTNTVHASLPILEIESLAGRGDVISVAQALTAHHAGGSPKLRKPSRALVPYLAHHRTAEQMRTQIAGALQSLTMPDLGSPLLPSLLQTGSVDSEGDTTHQAIKARSTYGISGNGINVGVLSDDDEFLTDLQATGDLPQNVTVLLGQDGNPTGPNATGEGTAMMKIVHDLAPNAHLFFATADNGENSFASNIRALHDIYGCQVICDDVFYLDEQPFSDSVVAQAVNHVTAAGGLYFSSAGNQGNLTGSSASAWEGDFVSGGPITLPGGTNSAGQVNNFGTAGAPVLFNTMIGNTFGTSVCLMWADPYNRAPDDYDLYVVDSTGSTVTSASTSHNTNSEPFEIVDAEDTDRVYVVLFRGNPCALHLTREPDGELDQNSMAFVTSGQNRGHSAAADAYAVAAAPATPGGGGPYPNPFSTNSPTEYFNSDGPRRIFYNVSATGVSTPVVAANKTTFASGGYITRQKPDITAADGVTTSVPGFAPFYGTSAAAPHAASIAALILSYSDNTTVTGLTITGKKLTTTEMRTTLTDGALDVDGPGVDRDSGAGIVMPLGSINFLQNFLPANSVKTTLSGTSTKVTWTTNLPASGTVIYGTNPANLNQTAVATGTTAHTVTITGLSPTLAYYYEINSATAANSLVFQDTAVRPLNSAAAAKSNILLVNLQLTRTTYNGVAAIQAKMTISNVGSGPANDAQLTSISLNGSAPLSTVPMDLGNLPATKSTTAIAYFPTLSTGTAAQYTVGGTDGNGNSFSTTVRVVIP